MPGAPSNDLCNLLEGTSDILSRHLSAHRQPDFRLQAAKAIRRFAPGESARLFGISKAHLRQCANGLDGPIATKPALRSTYSVEELQEVRRRLAAAARGRNYVPRRTDQEFLQVIAVANFKRGSGKTTTAAHLTQYLALRGYRVLAIDLDPQARLTALFGLQPELRLGENDTIYGATRFDEAARPLADIIRSTYVPDLHLVPASLELVKFEFEVVPSSVDRSSVITFHGRIAMALKPVENLFDVVVIDCPPQLGFLTLSALAAATGVLVTVHPQMLDVMSISRFLKMMGAYCREMEKAGITLQIDFLRYIITRFEPSDGPQTQMAAFLRDNFGDHVLVNPMLKSTAISDAGLTDQTLYEVERSSFSVKRTYDRAIEAMDAVNGEIESYIRKAWGRSS